MSDDLLGEINRLRHALRTIERRHKERAAADWPGMTESGIDVECACADCVTIEAVLAGAE